jgi:hypothetical protein
VQQGGLHHERCKSWVPTSWRRSFLRLPTSGLWHHVLSPRWLPFVLEEQFYSIFRCEMCSVEVPVGVEPISWAYGSNLILKSVCYCYSRLRTSPLTRGWVCPLSDILVVVNYTICV